MTLVLWGLCLAALALVARRQRIVERAELRALRWSYPVGLFCDETAPIALLAAQPAARTGLHAGAAILAVALAFDVSAASQAWSPPSSAEPLQVFEDQGLDLTAYAPGSWSGATLAADGWFV